MLPIFVVFFCVNINAFDGETGDKIEVKHSPFFFHLLILYNLPETVNLKCSKHSLNYYFLPVVYFEIFRFFHTLIFIPLVIAPQYILFLITQIHIPFNPNSSENSFYFRVDVCLELSLFLGSSAREHYISFLE